jgi:hypothetical protein
LFDGAAIPSRPTALMGHLIAPQPGLVIAFGQGGESPAGPEGVPHVADGSFHAPFLIAGTHLAGPGLEVVVGTQFEQTRVEEDLAAAPLQHGRLEIVVKNHAWLTVPLLKGVHMTAQEVLRGLIEEELQVQATRMRQRHREAGQRPAGASHPDMTEAGPISLCLLVMERVP